MLFNKIRLLLLFGCWATGFAGNAHALELTFGLYANDKASELVKVFRPLLDILEKSAASDLGEPVVVRMKVTGTYQQAIDDLVQGGVDFARFGPATYIEAKARQDGITIIAMETLKGKKTFRGLICVKEGAGVESIDQLKGKRFAFGAAESTIGRYLAQDLLVRNGIFAKDLASYEFLGRHDKVGAAVAAGLFDAGAIKEDTFLKLRKQGQPLREIAAMDNVTKPWLARAGLPEKTLLALRKALLEVKDFSSLDEADGMALGDDSDYQPVRAAMEKSRNFDPAAK